MDPIASEIQSVVAQTREAAGQLQSPEWKQANERLTDAFKHVEQAWSGSWIECWLETQVACVNRSQLQAAASQRMQIGDIAEAVESAAERGWCSWEGLFNDQVALTSRGKDDFIARRYPALSDRARAHINATGTGVRLSDAESVLGVPRLAVEHIWRELEAQGEIQVMWTDGFNDEVWDITLRLRRRLRQS